MQKIFEKSSRVLIMGAGLGGLTLAQGLKRAKIPFTIFERDATSAFRAQGYRIRINQDGAEAMKRTLDANLWNLFERTCAETKPGAFINALDANVINREPIPDPNKPVAKTDLTSAPYTADRTTIRSLLLLGLEDHVSFGKEFQKYTINSKGVTAHFKDGSAEEGTLLVGADGLRSRVRRQYLPDHIPVDTDGRCIYGKTPITPELKDKILSETTSHMSLIMDKRHKIPLSLFLEPVVFSRDPATESNGKLASVKDYIYWVLASRQATFGLGDTELLSLSNKDAANLSVKLTQDWDPKIRSLFDLQDVEQSSALRICSVKPHIPMWSPSENVTLLGDAVHVMSPTGGSGANTALQDAANLCEAIVEGGVSKESIGKYEEMMRDYAKKAIERSYMGAKKMLDQPPFEECKPVKF